MGEDEKKTSEAHEALALPLEDGLVLWRAKYGEVLPQSFTITLDTFYYILGKRLYDAHFLVLDEHRQEYRVRGDM